MSLEHSGQAHQELPTRTHQLADRPAPLTGHPDLGEVEGGFDGSERVVLHAAGQPLRAGDLA